MNDSKAQSDNTCYSCKNNSYYKNYNSDYDEDFNIKQKIIKQEEDEILQKLIECFNNSYGENTQNSSFEENSINFCKISSSSCFIIFCFILKSSS